MHEIRLTIAPDHLDAVAQLAAAKGVGPLAVHDINQLLPPRQLKQVSVNVSTPDACGFLQAVKDSPVARHPDFGASSRELRAIMKNEDIAHLTRPIGEPFEDVRQDLWQQSHLTSSYVARTIAGGVLLAMGIIDDKVIDIVLAALFIPFFAPVLAVAMGCYGRDRKLAGNGLRAILASLVLLMLSGVVTALCLGHPIAFHDFKDPLPSLALSAIIGVAAGLSTADDAGRRYLISVAAAVQLSVFPAWLGAALVAGLPPSEAVINRLLSFGINLAVIPVAAGLAYALLHEVVARKKRG